MSELHTPANPADWGGPEEAALNGVSGEGLARLWLRIIAEQPRVKSICDLGCGNGYIASLLGARGYHVLGIDSSRPYIDTANAKYRSATVRFQQAYFGADLEQSIGDQRFDLVMSSDVIEHLYRPADLVDAAWSLVKPGGTFIVGTPYHGYLKNLAIAVLDKWDEHHSVHWDGGHVKFFSVPTLRAAVERAGFVDARFRFYGRLPGLWKNMICIARRPA